MPDHPEQITGPVAGRVWQAMRVFLVYEGHGRMPRRYDVDREFVSEFLAGMKAYGWAVVEIKHGR